LCVSKALGDIPKFIDDPTWMERQAILLETEFQLLRQNQSVDDAEKSTLQGHFVKDNENPVQIGW